jgi:zinc protease
MMRRIYFGRCAALAGLVLAGSLASARVGAQQQAATRPQPRLDRSKEPKPDPTPRLRVPSWTETRLSNGAQLIVVERHTLPLVSFNITFVGGTQQMVPLEKTGLGTFVAQMLREGTKTRTGDDLSNAMQLLGSSLNVSVGGESGSIGFTAIKDKFEGMLALLEDVLVNPSFPSDALERFRAQTLVQLQQDRDRTSYLASVAFPKTIYTTAHPYGRSLTEATAKAITRDDLVNFHRQYFQPGRAIVIVVGDVNPTEVKQTIERVLSPWVAGGSRPSFNYPSLPAPKATTIYLVDKPGAEQSSFRIGLAGPPRDTPDYYALRVMSQLLGELFQSRLNATIREQKGYSYGVYSQLGFGRGPGPITTGGDIKTAQTDSALVEWMKEIRGIRGDKPITDEELAAGKAALTQSLPERFSSVGAVSNAVREIYVEGLPKDYYQRFVDAVNAVTKADVVRVARKYLDPDHLTIVIVGDRKQIEAPLTATKVAPVVVIEP